MKRVLLFLATNLAVMLLLGVIASVLGVGRYIGRDGLNLGALLGYALVFGFGGAMISLMMSKMIAKWSVGARVIDGSEGRAERFVVDTVSKHAALLGLRPPEVAIFDDPQMNAFATGPTKNSALVAVSTGLLANMNGEQIEAVIAHEMSHVSNGDMVTMTLIQGVVNTFVIFLARAAAYAVDLALSGNSDSEQRRGPGLVFMLASFVLELLFGFFASFIVAWFSRQREYRADAGAARLTSPRAMASALSRLGQGEGQAELAGGLNALGISSRSSWMNALSTHPTIEERIERLMGTNAQG